MKERINIFDNTKALLMFLVVIGHFADFYTNISENMRVVFFAIYLFHMPLFIFISGLFSKNAINGRFKIGKVLNYIVLYISLELLFFILERHILGIETKSFSIFMEDGVPWFLFAMAAWIALTYLLRDIRVKYLLPFTVLCSLFVGFDQNTGDILVSARIIVFYPFFLLGYFLDIEKITVFISQKKVKIISFIVIISSLMFIYFNIENLYSLRFLLTGRNTFEHLPNEWTSFFYRIALMIWTTIFGFSVLAIMNNKKTYFTKIGERTLQIYFLHQLLLTPYMYYNTNKYISALSPDHWLKIYMALSIVLTLILSLKIFEKPFQKVLRMEYKKILK